MLSWRLKPEWIHKQTKSKTKQKKGIEIWSEEAKLECNLSKSCLPNKKLFRQTRNKWKMQQAKSWAGKTLCKTKKTKKIEMCLVNKVKNIICTYQNLKHNNIWLNSRKDLVVRERKTIQKKKERDSLIVQRKRKNILREIDRKEKVQGERDIYRQDREG